MYLTFIASNTKRYNISGNYQGKVIETSLDHPLAAYYFNKLANGNYDEEMEQNLKHIFSSIPENLDLEEEIQFLNRTVSTDFATLYYIRNTYSAPKNHHAQELFLSYLNNPIDTRVRYQKAFEYVYVFIPGLFYIRHSDKGGDFKAQRDLLAGLGLSSYLIELNETGSVQENATKIIEEIKILKHKYSKIILISASKGGTDVAYALGKLMMEEDSGPIKAWVSIGGVLRGSEIADDYLSGFKRIYAKLVLTAIGAKMDFVEDLSHQKSVQRYDSLVFPDDLLIIHYVGTPFSGQISQEVGNNYEKLSAIGPNDGLTLLMDEVTNQGIVINEIGLDHYYKDPNIDEKSIALLFTALELMSR